LQEEVLKKVNHRWSFALKILCGRGHPLRLLRLLRLRLGVVRLHQVRLDLVRDS
jgi:hypothetical protein